MDTITYFDNDGNQVMITADALPGVVMDLEGASVEVEEVALENKTYVHIRKKDGMSITLIYDEHGETALSDAIFNTVRVRKGLGVVDVGEYITKLLRESYE